MTDDPVPSAQLHNVAELSAPDWADGGHRLHRAPERVRAAVNPGARERLSHPTGCELRTVPTDGAVEVTLSAAESVPVRLFWGPFQVPPDDGAVEIGPTPRTIRRAVPPAIERLRPGIIEDCPIDPHVFRVRFERTAPAAVHGVAGGRPPEGAELPDEALLAYGTSITEGAKASAVQTGYVARTARLLGVDAITLGTSGSAFCEPAIAEYVAGRGDWHIAVLAVSVNMANSEFTVEQFRERARTLVRTVATANPERPVVAVTLFPYHADIEEGGDRERARAFREAVRSIVEAGPGNAHLVSGPELMAPTGLTTDMLHPGDAGMADIARGLADRIRELRA